MFGFFFNMHRTLLRVKCHDTITLWVDHVIGKHGGPLIAQVRGLQLLDQIMTIKNIVAQHQGAVVMIDKIATNQKSLCQSFWFGLNGILNVHAPLGSILE